MVKVRSARLRLVSTLAAFLTLIAGSAVVAADAPHDLPETVVHAYDYSFDGPDAFETGLRRVTLENLGDEPHHLQFALLNDGVDMASFGEALATQGPGALSMVTLTGGPGLILPGATTDTLVDFALPGTYALLCFIETADGVPHLALGMVDALEVTGEPRAAAELDADVEVRMVDFAYTMPSSIPAGRTTWKVINDGPQPHELIVLELADGADFGTLMQHLAEHGEEGMPAMPVGGAQGLSAGLASYLDWELEPGAYVAICFIPDPETGLPHLALGMAAPFTVEAN